MSENRIESLLEDAMTVEDLIGVLSELDPKSRVVIGSDYGDRSHTIQAIPVTYCECLDAFEEIRETAYSKSDIGIFEADEPDEGFRDVVILKG